MEENAVHLITISKINELIAITTNEKSLFIGKIEENHVKILSRRFFARTASSIKFSSCGKVLFLADKTGDVFEYSCEDHKLRGKFRFGHISQILDLKVSHDTKFIITSDRDEKIRISNYPATHEIEAFCLGHLEFVSSVDFIDSSRLVSVSGDKTLKVWSFPEGKQQHLTEFEFTPIIVKAFSKSETEGLIFISTDTHHLHVFEYNLIENTMKLHEKGRKEYPSDVDIAISSDQFYVRYVQDGKVFIDNIIVKEKLIVYKNLYEDIQTLLNASDLSATTYKPFEVKHLYKSKFIERDEYAERKKARIERVAEKTKRQRKNHRDNQRNRQKNEDEMDVN